MQQVVLEDLINRFPECRAASYANMQTMVTFLSAGVTGADQLQMEKICSKAAETLGASEREDESRSDFAALVTKDEMHLFFRNAQDPEEVLICSCGIYENSVEVLQAMQDAMERLND